METKLIKLNSENFDAAVDEAAELIKKGGVVGMPTETVYGLAASAFDESAVEAIFEAKGRPQDNPLIVHICDYVMLKDVVASIPPAAAELMRGFWPGPLTVILPRSSAVVPAVSCGLDTVAVRMPSNPVATELIRRSSLPLAAPSANLSGRPSPTTAAHVMRDLKGKIPLILDGGACTVGIESTVISFCCEAPTILRPGIISLEDIKERVPDAVMSEYAVEPVVEGGQVSSPGLKHRHYSPKAAVTLVRGELSEFADYVAERRGAGVFAMCFSGEQDAISIPSVEYGARDDYAAQARCLYATLRTLDMLDAQCIYVRCPEMSDRALPVYNRLIRAAGFEVVEL